VLKALLNLLYRSAHWFPDGSSLSYTPREDAITYSAVQKRKIASIPLSYNDVKKKLQPSSGPWYWRDPEGPPHVTGRIGPPLTESERAEIIPKLRIFLAKQPKMFATLS
jgi:hypothetical protein